MAGIQWREEYAVGIPEIDGQHQGLVALIGRLHEAMLTGRSRRNMAPMIAELVEYTKVHFATEERRMEAVSYPELAHHRDIHRRFVHRVAAFQRDLGSGRVIMGMEVMTFLQDWLVKHILDEDQAYGPWLRGEVKAPEPESTEQASDAPKES